MPYTPETQLRDCRARCVSLERELQVLQGSLLAASTRLAEVGEFVAAKLAKDTALVAREALVGTREGVSEPEDKAGLPLATATEARDSRGGTRPEASDNASGSLTSSVGTREKDLGGAETSPVAEVGD